MPPSPSLVDQDDLDAYWSAVAGADEQAALGRAAEVRRRGVPLEEVLERLVVASQLRVGELWASNAWSVGREHAATAVSEAVVHGLGAGLPRPTDGPALAVACVEREWHALPALVVTQVLTGAGCRAEFLGASASREQLVAHVLATRPRAVLLSASLTSSLPRVRRQVESLLDTGTPVVVGGRAFDAAGRRARQLGATAHAPTPRAALDLLDTLPVHVPPAAPLQHPGAVEAERLLAGADAVTRDVIAATDAALGLSGGGESAVSPDDWRVVLATFVPHVVDSLAGALLTEDPTIVVETRAWLGEVLAGRGARIDAVPVLLGALRERLRDCPEARALLAG